MDYLKIFLDQARFSLLGQISQRGIAMLSVVVITRIVSPEIFGDYIFLISIVGILYGFSNLGIPRAISYFIPIFLKNGDASLVTELLRTASSVVLSILVTCSVLLLVFSRVIVEYLDKAYLYSAFVLLPCIILVYGTRDLVNEYFVAIKKISYRELIESLISPSARFLITVALLLTGFKLMGLVLGYLLGSVVAVIVGIWILWRSDSYPLADNKDGGADTVVGRLELRALLNYSLPLAGVEIIGTVMTYVHRFLLGILAVTAAPGLFQLGLSVAALATIMPGSLKTIAKPVFAELSVNKEDGELLSVFRRSARWSLLLTFPVGIFLIVKSTEVVELLFSRSYAGTAVVVPLLVAATIFPLLWGQLAVFIKGTGDTSALLRVHIIVFAIVVILDLLLIPRYGLIGAGMAAILVALADTTMRITIVKKYLGQNPYDRLHFKTLAAGLLTFFAVFLFDRWTNIPYALLVYPLLISALFVFLVLMFGAIDETDAEIADRISNKIEAHIGLNLHPVVHLLRLCVR